MTPCFTPLYVTYALRGNAIVDRDFGIFPMIASNSFNHSNSKLCWRCSMYRSVRAIADMRSPPQIIQRIIGLVAIVVASLKLVVWIADERHQDQSMNANANVVLQFHCVVSASNNVRYEDATENIEASAVFTEDCSVKRSDASLIRCLVTRMSRYRLPDFFHFAASIKTAIVRWVRSGKAMEPTFRPVGLAAQAGL